MDVGFRARVMNIEGEPANKIEAWLGFNRSAQRTGSIISIGAVIESCRFLVGGGCNGGPCRYGCCPDWTPEDVRLDANRCMDVET